MGLGRDGIHASGFKIGFAGSKGIGKIMCMLLYGGCVGRVEEFVWYVVCLFHDMQMGAKVSILNVVRA